MTINYDDIISYGLTLNSYLALLKIYLLNHTKEDELLYRESLDDLRVLEVKGLLKITSDNNGINYSIRKKGMSIVSGTTKFTKTSTTEKAKNGDMFDEFWELYPSSDRHSIYTKTRVLRSNRLGCKKKYYSLLKEGVLHSDIIKAVRYEVEERKRTSGKENKLSFMKNTNTWLNQREYEVILESIKDDDTDDYDGDWASTKV